MSEYVMKIIISGICAIVLDGSPGSTIHQQANLVLIDAVRAGTSKHYPRLVVDRDQLSDFIFEKDFVPKYPPFSIPDPAEPGQELVVWPLEGQELTFDPKYLAAPGCGTPQQPKNCLSIVGLAGLPRLDEVASPKAADVDEVECLKPASASCPVASVVRLPKGGALLAEGGLTPREWCFENVISKTDSPVRGRFRVTAAYDARLEKQWLGLELKDLSGKKATILLVSKDGSPITLLISNEPFEKDCSKDNRHAAAYYRLSLTPAKDQFLPFVAKPGEPCDESAGGGCGMGVGCSPVVMFEKGQ